MLVAAAGATERLRVGTLMLNTDTGWVVVDELGEPVHPEWYSDEFKRVRKRAGVPRMCYLCPAHRDLPYEEGARAYQPHQQVGRALRREVHVLAVRAR